MKTGAFLKILGFEQFSEMSWAEKLFRQIFFRPNSNALNLFKQCINPYWPVCLVSSWLWYFTLALHRYSSTALKTDFFPFETLRDCVQIHIDQRQAKLTSESINTKIKKKLMATEADWACSNHSVTRRKTLSCKFSIPKKWFVW